MYRRTARQPVPLRRLAPALSGLILTACGDGSSSGTGAGSPAGSQADLAGHPALRSLLEEIDVPEGGGKLLMSGHAEADGSFETASHERYRSDAAHVFQPASGGTNADGPYEIMVYGDAIHPASGEAPVRAWLAIALPADPESGTYEIVRMSQAGEDQAGARLVGDGYAWTFSRIEEGGELHLGETGETITASWTFTAADRAGETVDVRGGVRGLGFSPQAEYTYEISANGETLDNAGRAAIQSNAGRPHSLALSTALYLELPEDISTGEYAIKRSSGSDDVVTVTLPDMSIGAADGSLVAEREGNTLEGRFSFETSGDDALTVSGEFSHVKLPGG